MRGRERERERVRSDKANRDFKVIRHFHANSRSARVMGVMVSSPPNSGVEKRAREKRKRGVIAFGRSFGTLSCLLVARVR